MSQQLYYNSYDGQSLYDVAAAVYGDARMANDLAIGNGLSLTDKLLPGQKILIVEGKYVLNVLQVYKNAAITPATAETQINNIEVIDQDGIGFMKIGSTFIVR